MMLLEIPVISPLVCYLSEIPIIGNPIYPVFNTYDIRDECHSPLDCNPDLGLSLYITSGKMKPIIRGGGAWTECSNTAHLV